MLRTTFHDPRALVEEFDARTEAAIKPWYDAQMASDRMRFADMNALREGHRLPEPAGELSIGIRALLTTMGLDADLLRAGLEYVGTITPIQRILARPAVQERIRAARETLKNAPAMAMPGPDRKQLLELVS